MVNEDLFTDDENRDAYDYLTISIEAKANRLNLLIAVCDDASFRDEIIAQYEAELQPKIRCYRATLARGEPSLRAAIAELVKQEEYLQQHNPAVITVTGAEQLNFIKLGEKRSEQEIFFGYLQWTREGLREFPFAIVLWVTKNILVNLIKKAPDFWSWRNGVFTFLPKNNNSIYNTEWELMGFPLKSYKTLDFNNDNIYLLPIEDLQRFIHDSEQRGIYDSTLATLYFSLGDIYRKRLESGECQDYKNEQELGIKYLSKAVKLQRALGLDKDLATSLQSFASLYAFQGKYNEAEPLYRQALELKQRLLGQEHPDVATGLDNLANLYYFQKKYSEAEPLYCQALESRQRWLGNQHPSVATSLNNLAILYASQGKFNEAEPLLYQALEILQRLLGHEHLDVAICLNNLGRLYASQKKYSEAKTLYCQALEIKQRILGKKHPSVATSFNNLANLYKYQGKYNEAEHLYCQALEITQSLLGKEHLDVVEILENLGLVYYHQEKYSEAELLFQEALNIKQNLLGTEHPSVTNTLNNLAHAYQKQEKFREAESLYCQASEILTQRLGVHHPDTITVDKNLAFLRERFNSEQ